MSQWNHKDEWRMSGKGFLVTVSRHSVNNSYDEYEGVNRWAVYAYIYPGHWHFPRFEGKDMWQEAAVVMPIHGGPSFLKWHYDDAMQPCSVQVGGDYHHLHDDFTRYATKEDAYAVFRDAEELFKWLQEEK